MNIISQILEYMHKASGFLPHKKQLGLSPNPNLPAIEQFLQAKLLTVIDEFGSIALMIDTLGPDPKMLLAWSEAQYNVFSQIISQFAWE